MDSSLYRFSSAMVASAASTVSPSYDSGDIPNPGDIELLVCESADEAVTLADAQGFVEVANSPVSAPDADPTKAVRLTVFWRRNSGESDPTVNNPGDHISAVMHCFGAVDSDGNPWDSTIPSSETTADTSGSATGGSTSLDSSLVVILGATAVDSWSGGFVTAWANADFDSLVEADDQSHIAGNGGQLFMALGAKSEAGSFGATTYTTGANTYKAHLVVVLNPIEADEITARASRSVIYARVRDEAEVMTFEANNIVDESANNIVDELGNQIVTQEDVTAVADVITAKRKEDLRVKHG